MESLVDTLTQDKFKDDYENIEEYKWHYKIDTKTESGTRITNNTQDLSIVS